MRDLLINPQKVPGDIDISTDAPFDEICKTLPDTRAIGKAFGVGLVGEGKHSFEVATFRKEADYADRRHPSLVGPGTMEEDSARRDFTLNAMYFDPQAGIIVDFHEGLQDLKKKTISCVGDAHVRLHEDPLRILRLFRFSANFAFKIEANTGKAAEQLGSELLHVSKERVLLEISKLKSAAVPLFAQLFKQVQNHLVGCNTPAGASPKFPWTSFSIPASVPASSPGMLFAAICAANEFPLQSDWLKIFQDWPFSLEEKAQLELFQRLQNSQFRLPTNTEVVADWRSFLESMRWLQRQSRITAEAALWILNWPGMDDSKNSQFINFLSLALNKTVSESEELQHQPIGSILESWLRGEAQSLREKANKSLDGQKEKSALGWARLLIDTNILLKKISCTPASGPSVLMLNAESELEEICNTAIQLAGLARRPQ